MEGGWAPGVKLPPPPTGVTRQRVVSLSQLPFDWGRKWLVGEGPSAEGNTMRQFILL
jgi:hypothetical protein